MQDKKSETKIVGVRLGSDFFSLTKELQYKIIKFILASSLISLGIVVFIIIWKSSGFIPSLVFGVVYFIFLIKIILKKISNKYLPTEKQGNKKER